MDNATGLTPPGLPNSPPVIVLLVPSALAKGAARVVTFFGMAVVDGAALSGLTAATAALPVVVVLEEGLGL